jgi:hypothetical protein
LKLLGEAHKAAATGDVIGRGGGESQEEQKSGSRQKGRNKSSLHLRE